MFFQAAPPLLIKFAEASALAWVLTSLVMYASLAVGALEIEQQTARETDFYGTGWNFVYFLVSLMLPWVSVGVMLIVMLACNKACVVLSLLVFWTLLEEVRMN